MKWEKGHVAEIKLELCLLVEAVHRLERNARKDRILHSVTGLIGLASFVLALVSILR